jgi:hypothetical protein
MLQINQTEKPTCSATIDQIRLRRAMTLPLVSQNDSSSGRQSEIQVASRLLIVRCPLSIEMVANGRKARSDGAGAGCRHRATGQAR